MRQLIFTILASTLLVAVSNAFLNPQYAFYRPPSLLMAVDLAPEPEGGEEMTAISSMAGSRMKNMGENSKVKNDDGTVYNFWLLSEAESKLIQEIRTQILKDAKKKANFPGFRKVIRHPAANGFFIDALCNL